jgi:hypothetical protein
MWLAINQLSEIFAKLFVKVELLHESLTIPTSLLWLYRDQVFAVTFPRVSTVSKFQRSREASKSEAARVVAKA